MLLAGVLLALVWSMIAVRVGAFGGPPLLPAAPAVQPGAWPAVTCLVPARDEAASIVACITALRAQDYPGPLEIVLVDDASSDATAALAAATTGAHPLTVLRAPPLPAGWTGKVAAQAHGIDWIAARSPAPAFLWLTDADIAHAPHTLRRLVAQQQRTQAALVSVMVALRCQSWWERWLIPAFIYFFQLLYPFDAVNRPGSRVAGAAGGCMLLRWDMVARIGGWTALRSAVIDDCTLAGLVKRHGGALWLGFADTSRALRGADTLAPLWRMVARSAFVQLGLRWRNLAGCVLGMLILFWGPLLAVLLGLAAAAGAVAAAGALAWALMAFSMAPTLRRYGQPLWHGLLLPVVTTLYLAMTIDSAVQHARGRGAGWKGRSYG